MRRALLLIAALASFPAAAQQPHNASIEKVLTRLRLAVQGSPTVVRLYYRASSCADIYSQQDPVAVPMRRLRPADNAAASIRAMFAGVDRVRIVDGPGDIVRITIDDPPASILQTPVSMQLGEFEQYNAMTAMFALSGSADMLAAERTLGIERPVTVVSILGSIGGPRLPESFDSILADDFLDLVGRTFGRMITYSVCPDGRTYNLRAVSTDLRDPVVGHLRVSRHWNRRILQSSRRRTAGSQETD